MKMADTLAAIGVMTIVFITAKTAICIYKLVCEPAKLKKEES